MTAVVVLAPAKAFSSKSARRQPALCSSSRTIRADQFRYETRSGIGCSMAVPSATLLFNSGLR